MSFGYSVSDVITVGRLIADLARCLKDVGGSKSEYQELRRELDCLDDVLKDLDKRSVGMSSSSTLNAIKAAALHCRHPLEEFLGGIQKYDELLGTQAKGSSIKSTASKVRWAFQEKDKVQKLQNYLNVHIGTINMQLAKHGLEMLDLVSDKVRTDQLSTPDGLEGIRATAVEIKDNCTTQLLVVRQSKSILARLSEMMSGEYLAMWRSILGTVTGIRYAPFQTMLVCLETKLIHRKRHNPGDVSSDFGD